ncbi:MAG: hypothetical protein DWH78_15655, partial [Planctomycetota bacterium]
NTRHRALVVQKRDSCLAVTGVLCQFCGENHVKPVGELGKVGRRGISGNTGERQNRNPTLTLRGGMVTNAQHRN